MNIFEIAFYLYVTLFLIRFFVPNTGQMYFNRPYQFLVKITDPLSKKIYGLLPKGKEPLSFLIVFLSFLFLQALFITGSTQMLVIGGTSRFSPVGGIRFIYASSHLPASIHYCLFKYTLFLFQFFIVTLIVVSASYLKRINNHIFLIFHNFISSFTEDLFPFKNKINIYERPLASILFLFLFFSFLTILILLAGTGMNILPFPSRGINLIIMRVLVVHTVLIVNVGSLIVPLLFLRIILSWFLPGRTMFSDALNILTDPILLPFRRLNLHTGGIDFSPALAIMAVIFALQFISSILNNVIVRL